MRSRGRQVSFFGRTRLRADPLLELVPHPHGLERGQTQHIGGLWPSCPKRDESCHAHKEDDSTQKEEYLANSPGPLRGGGIGLPLNKLLQLGKPQHGRHVQLRAALATDPLPGLRALNRSLSAARAGQEVSATHDRSPNDDSGEDGSVACVKKWGQAPRRMPFCRGFFALARSQSPFFHKLSEVYLSGVVLASGSATACGLWPPLHSETSPVRYYSQNL